MDIHYILALFVSVYQLYLEGYYRNDHCFAGFQVSADKMLFYLLNIILTSLAGTSVALCFSASTRQHTIGTIFTALVWVVMMVYSGVLVNIETIPRWLQWINWLSIFRYSINVSYSQSCSDLKVVSHRICFLSLV